MNPCKTAFILWLLILFVLQPVSAVTVEPQHPVYGFLQRMAVKGLIPYSYFASLPLPEKTVKDLLQKVSGHRDMLSAGDRTLFGKYRQEFFTADEWLPTKLRYNNGKQALEGRVTYYTLGQYRDSLPDNQLFAFGTLSLLAKGQFYPGFEFMAEAAISQERNRDARFLEQYNPQMGQPYNTPDVRKSDDSLFNASTFDAYRALVAWQGARFRLDGGIDWNQWGPGIWQHPSISQKAYFWVQDSLNFDVALQDGPYEYWTGHRRGYRFPGENAPMAQLRMTADWDFLHYTKFIAEKVGLTHDSSGYLTGHRLELRLGGFVLGGYEMLAYNRDELEWSYLFPLVPLYMAEHSLGDQDNASLGIDIQYFLKGRARFYAELFLDDLLSPTDIFRDYWGNKFAFTVGTEWADLLLPGTNWGLEYSRVEPWLYSHNLTNTQFQHYGSLTGSGLLPNSHALRFRWELYLEFPVTLRTEYGFQQHKHLARGSSPFDVHDDINNETTTKTFLGSDPETRHSFDLSVRYYPNRLVQLQVFGGFFMVENWESRSESLNGMHTGGEVLLRY